MKDNNLLILKVILYYIHIFNLYLLFLISFIYVELGVLRPAEGSRKFSSEIIPGFLWIGNSTSARNNELNQLRATLLINCTNNLKNPKPRPPYYRCKDIPLLENLNESEEKPTLEYLLETGNHFTSFLYFFILIFIIIN